MRLNIPERDEYIKNKLGIIYIVSKIADRSKI